jgi:hypothetical protein
MPNINSLLARSIMAYRRGLNSPVPLSDQFDETSCQKSIDAFVSRSLSTGDQATYRTIMHLIGVAANLRKQTLLIESRQILERAKAHIISNTSDDLLQLLGRACIAQAESELCFQLRDYQATRDCISKSLEYYQVLEQKYTLSVLHIYRMQQVLLWIRTCTEAGQESQAIDLAQEAIEYLCGYGRQLSISGGWFSSLLQDIPKQSRYALIAQFASEVGCILSRQSDQEASMFFSRFHAWEHFARHEHLQEIYDWGILKKAFLEKDFQVYLTNCIPLLKSGRRDTLLWDLTVLDLCCCCKILRPDQTVDFLDEVSENTSQMRDIPPGGYSLPTDIYYKRIFVVKNDSFPAFVLPTELFSLLKNIAARPAVDTYKFELTTRRFHAYNVGMPRSGCSSIMALFSNYRAVAEYKERESVELITAWKDGWISEETLRRYIHYRHDIGQLEMDTASFNHFYLHILIKEFPQAKFTFTIRDCYTWVNSFLKMISRWKKHFLDIGQNMPDWMLGYGRILFGAYDWDWFNSYEALQENLDSLVVLFIKSWAHYNLRILELLPVERSILVKTSEISYSQAKLADFVGVPADTITEHHHINSAPDKIDLLEGFGRARFHTLSYKYEQQVQDCIDNFNSRESQI